MTRSIKRIVLIVIAAITLLLCGFYFLAPIHVTASHDSKSTALMYVNEVEKARHSISKLSNFKIEIVNVSSKDQVVELALPIPDNAPRLRFEDLLETTGDWKITYGGERVESRTPGSRLVFTMRSVEPEIPFLQRADGGIAVVSTADGFKTTVYLRNERNDFKTIKIPARELRTMSLAGTLSTVSSVVVRMLNAGSKAHVVVNVGGGLQLYNEEINADNQVSSIKLNGWNKIQLMFEAAKRFWVPFGSAILLAILFLVVGEVLLCGFLFADPNKIDWLQAFTVGLCAIALLSNTLVYFVAAEKISKIAFVLFLITISKYLFNQFRHRQVKCTTGCSMPLRGVFIGFCSVLITFWPVLYTGSSYIGLLQTDSFAYANMANAMQENSLLYHIERGSIVGYGLRSIDTALIALVASIGNSTTETALLIVSQLFVFIPPVFTYQLGLRMWTQRTATVTAWAVAMSAPLTGLFFESYISQFLLTGFLYINLYAGWLLYENLKTQQLSWSNALPFVLSTAVVALLYPYFGTLTIAIATVLLINARRYGQVKQMFVYAASTLAAGNIGILFLLNQSAAIGFSARLNDIARWIVFPFYNTWKFPSFMFGLTPFHGSGQILSALSDEFENAALSATASYAQFTESAYIAIPIAAIIGTYMFALWEGRRHVLVGFNAVLPISLVFYVLQIVITFRLMGLYAYAKLTWTFASLLPILMIPIIMGLQTHQKIYVKLLTAIVIYLFILANAVAKISPTILWSANPYGIVSRISNTEVAGPLIRYQVSGQSLTHAENSQKFYFLVADQNRHLDQKSLIYAGHMLSFMTAYGYSCGNCYVSKKELFFKGITDIKPTENESSVRLIDVYNR